MATETGVWDLQDVRDKQLASQWTYNAPGGDTGALWTWGSAQYGQLGTNDRTSRSSPIQVGTRSDWSGGQAMGQSNDATMYFFSKQTN